MLNPEDRNAIDTLFARLEDVEKRSGPRDADAEDLIRRRMAEQPGSAYYLAQTVVVQERALEEAQHRIEALEAQVERGTQARRGPWGGDNRQVQADERYDRRGGNFGGGGFLAGAAQTAMGVAGGLLLGNMIAGMFGAGHANASESQQDDGGDQGRDDFSGDDTDFGGNDFDSGGDF